jgi:ABC-type antimicrobial peptide transport system permease subunit
MSVHTALDRVRQDLRYAWRGLRRTPAFTAAAIATLALGIGAMTSMFGLVDAVVFQPTGVVRIGQVYAVGLSQPALSARDRRLRFMDADALERTPPASVTAVTSVGIGGTSGIVQIAGRAENVLTERVTAGYATVFGLSAQAGRWIAEEDNRGAGTAVAVISDRLWRQWFHASLDIVGRATVTMGQPYRVIGVAPPGFRGTQTGLVPTDVWLPLGHPVALPGAPAGAVENRLRGRSVVTFVRTRAGASTSEVAGEIGALVGGQPDADPNAATIALQPAAEALRVTELVALAAGVLAFSALVFLAACANLANLFYARGTERAGEFAVRRSLGARTSSLFGLMLAESGIIAIAAASAGLAVAIGATTAFTAAFPTFRLARNLGVTIDLSPDYRVFLYAFGSGLAAALVVGLLTAWHASRVPVIRGIGAAATAGVVTSRRRSLPLTFVSVQVTAAVLLLIGAGLFLENTRSVLDRQVHYDTSQLAAARVMWTDEPATPSSWAEQDAIVERRRAMTSAERAAHDEATRAASHASREAFFSTLLERARDMPGVEAAALTDALPGGTAPAPRREPGVLQITAGPDGVSGRLKNLDASWISVSPGFLTTAGLRLLRGRDIQPADAYGAPLVAVLSRSAAEGLWQDEDPIGNTITCCQLKNQTLTVVGVADDPVSSSDRSPRTRHSNFVLLSSAQAGNHERFIVVRTATPVGQVDALRALIHGLDPRVPVFDAGPVDEFLLAGVAIARAQRVVSVSLGLLALGIATFGIYGVVGYFVSRRTREFGLRLALGATPRQILKLVVDYSVHIILIGLLPAVLLASLGTRLFEHQLPGLMPNSITMWVVAPLIMLATGVLAGLVPARRASRVDPNVTLREL